MFDKWLGLFKKNLPESLHNKEMAKESQEDASAEHSEEESGESHDTLTNASEEEQKKKRISMILRVLIALGLGYFVTTEFLFKPEAQNEIPVVAIKKRPRKKVDIKPPEEKTANVSPGDQGATATKPAETSSSDLPAPPPPPVENVNIADKKVEEKALEEPKPQTTSELEIKQETDDKKPSTSIASTEAGSKTGEVKGEEVQGEKSIDSLIDTIDSPDKAKSEAKQPENLADKIVADDVYTSPPAYDQLGRGLVYNCKEKFWACLERTAYVTCNKNMKWNDSHGKASECVVQNVYSSEEDCNTVQKYNVSTNKPTDFCKL